MNRFRALASKRYQYDEAEGYPCTFTQSVGKNLRDYKIYGNSTQNGTPTLTNPINVVSLGENGNVTVKLTQDTAEKATTISLTGHSSLRKIGDYADYIDFKNKRIVRQVNEKIFTGTETIGKNVPSVTDYVYYMALPHITSNACYCNYLTYSSWANSSNTYSLANSANYLYFNIKDAITENTATAVKAKLAEWYQAGNPLKVYYILQTPTYEPITLPNIPTFNGTNTITAYDNLLNATKIWCEYYKGGN